jgi:hypothetical protein
MIDERDCVLHEFAEYRLFGHDCRSEGGWLTILAFLEHPCGKAQPEQTMLIPGAILKVEILRQTELQHPVFAYSHPWNFEIRDVRNVRACTILDESLGLADKACRFRRCAALAVAALLEKRLGTLVAANSLNA